MRKSVLVVLTCAVLGSMAHADESFSQKYQIVVPPAPQFTPTKVWDDGKFTHIQLRAPYHGDLPAVFESFDDGRFAVVDTKWDQATSQIVVRKIIDHVVLRLGEKHVEIDRS
ncbi:MAG: TrbG/VirB9 family P-type conjugative transfer protein [Pseudomonadota bacterium]